MIHKNDKISCKAAMQLIGNISQATASRYIHQVRTHLKKEEHHILTVGEFCEYYGIKLEQYT